MVIYPLIARLLVCPMIKKTGQENVGPCSLQGSEAIIPKKCTTDEKNVVVTYCRSHKQVQSRLTCDALGCLRDEILNEKIRRRTRLTDIAHRINNLKWQGHITLTINNRRTIGRGEGKYAKNG
ncbi:hypothetical protein EVAR_5094_1 [Eumeta japonica]|uniref:Uncharacterized protein n=1 Tax=Eumeta variegata TaxID=151549 RepID=A0A4C1SX88_EUMVA|nr:hypothetical protein EVAR_5094_1 [Eumeta japonica]